MGEQVPAYAPACCSPARVAPLPRRGGRPSRPPSLLSRSVLGASSFCISSLSSQLEALGTPRNSPFKMTLGVCTGGKVEGLARDAISIKKKEALS